MFFQNLKGRVIFMVKQLMSNSILWTTIAGWAIAQALKIFIGVVRKRKFDFSWFITTGGMPSSHAAGVSTLATCIGISQGFASPLFALAAIFAFITMFDAQTSRRSVGVQARILNNIMDDIYFGRKINEKKLKELMGHTPVEVFVGMLIGILVAYTFYHK